MLKLVGVDDSMGGVLLTLQRASEDTAAQMRDAADAAIESSWIATLTALATTAQQTKLLVTGANATVDDLGFSLIAAAGPALSGGLDNSHWYAVDMGMKPQRIAAPTRRRTIRIRGTGRTFQAAVLIWVGRNLPARVGRPGRVVYRAIGEQSQAYVGAWVEGMLSTLDGSELDVDAGEIRGQVAGSWQ